MPTDRQAADAPDCGAISTLPSNPAVNLSANPLWRRLSLRPAGLADWLMALSLFATLVIARTAGVSSTMWLLGDQIRDWTVALGPAAALPLTGPASVAGGTSLGPYFYWGLWAIRVSIGGWFDNLPHAGVVGYAFLHAAADVFLFFAVRKISGSAVLALATLLLIVTSPFDLAISATIWNPGPAESLLKIALALFLFGTLRPSRWGMAATVAAAWIAVQTHSSMILVSLPLISWFIIREIAARQWRSAVETIRLTIEIVLVLQIPYFIDRMVADTPRGGPAMIAQAVLALVKDPLAARPDVSFTAVVRSFRFLWALPDAAWWLPWLLGMAAAGVMLVARRRPHLAFVTILPITTAVVGFAAWPQIFDTYWFMGLAVAAGLTLAVAVCALPEGRPREAVALLFLGLVLAALPARLDASRSLLRLSEYGPLIDGTREIARHTREVGEIVTTFDLPPYTDPAFPFRCMGGTLTPDAEYDGVIARDGSVTFRPRRSP